MTMHLQRRIQARRHAGRAQRGMSLIELMVGLTIGMLLVAGLALMFGNASSSYTEIDKSARQIENGRYAVDLLEQEIALAGFYGTIPSSTTTAVATYPTKDPCLTSAEWKTELDTMKTTPLMPFGIKGFTPTEASTLAASYSTCLPNYKSGTPIVAIRRLDTNAKWVTNSSLTLNVLYVQSSHYRNDTTSTYVPAIATHSSSDVTTFNLKNLNGSGGSGSDVAANQVRQFISRIYYLASCNDCSGGGDGIPTLKMSDLSAATFNNYALAEGIEQMGIDYGIDTNGDGTPDEWYGLNDTAASTESAYIAGKGWGNVMAVRIYLLARNTESTATWTDTRTYSIGSAGTAEKASAPGGSYKRRAYVTTIRLQTPAGRRES